MQEVYLAVYHKAGQYSAQGKPMAWILTITKNLCLMKLRSTKRKETVSPEELVGKTAIAIVNLPPRNMMGIDSEGMLISAVHEEDGHEGLNLLMVNDRIPAGAKLY